MDVLIINWILTVIKNICLVRLQLQFKFDAILASNTKFPQLEKKQKNAYISNLVMTYHDPT